MIIVNTTPAQNAFNIPTDVLISVVFDNIIDTSTVDNSSIILVTQKKNIVTTKNGIVQPSEPYIKEIFFVADNSSLVPGTVSVVDNTITFKPKVLLSASTAYQVYISKTIKDINGDSLSKIATFKFTTAAEDMAEPLPTNIPVNTILDTYVDFIEDISEAQAFRILEVSPGVDTFLNNTRTIKIKFSEEPDDNNIEDLIIVKIYDLLSDYPPTITTDYTVSVSGTIVTIVLSEDIDIVNKIFSIELSENLTSTLGNALNTKYIWSYIGWLEPYYSSTKMLRLYAGTVLGQVSDINLALAIYVNSIDANRYMLNSRLRPYQQQIFKEKWTLYASLLNVLTNNIDFSMPEDIKKQLGEFSLQTSGKHHITLYNSLISQCQQKLNNLKSMMNFLPSGGYFIKSAAVSPDSGIGRRWVTNIGINTSTDGGERNVLTWNDELEGI